MALTWVCFSFTRLCRKTRLHPFWPLSRSVAAAVSLAQSTLLITNSQWCFVSSNKILTAGKFRYIVPACVQTLCVSHNGCSVCFKMLFLCSFPRLHCIVITFRWDTWKRSESEINLHALLTAVFRNVDTDTVTRLIINPSPSLDPLLSPLYIQLASSWQRSTMSGWTWALPVWGLHWWPGQACWRAPPRSPSASGNPSLTIMSSPPLRSGRNAARLWRYEQEWWLHPNLLLT